MVLTLNRFIMNISCPMRGIKKWRRYRRVVCREVGINQYSEGYRGVSR